MREIRPYGSEGGGGETLPTPLSSRWLRSVSDGTTGQRQDQRSCTPARVPAAFLIACKSGGVAALNHRLQASDAFGIF